MTKRRTELVLYSPANPPPCPLCRKKNRVVAVAETCHCTACGIIFDYDPNEGGTHDDRYPDRRMIREESRREKWRRV